MCGIAGYYCFGNLRPSYNEITQLFTALEDRGRDASGYAFINEGKLEVYKKPVPSSRLVRSKRYKKFAQQLPKCLLLHCRQATQGSVYKNVNNHPIFSKGVAVVHNGIINNYEDVYRKYSYQPDGEVDSEAIIACLLQAPLWTPAIKKVTKNLEGNYTFAAISSRTPNVLVLLRRESPLAIGIDKQRDILFFASTKTLLKEMSQEIFRGFYLSNDTLKIQALEKDTVMIIDEEGLCQSYEFKPKDPFVHVYVNENYNRYLLYHCEVCNHSFSGNMVTYDNDLFGWVCDSCRRSGVYKNKLKSINTRVIPLGGGYDL